MHRVTVLVPAAGLSSRMGGADKLMRQVDGVPQLRRIVSFAAQSGCECLVTLPGSVVPFSQPRQEALQGLNCEVITVADHRDGMSASLRAAAVVLAQRSAAAVMIVPADMPEITLASLEKMLCAHRAAPTAILRGAAAGKPGHPVLIPQDLIGSLASLSGDHGAREVIAANAARVRLVALEGAAALLDLDTPGEWQAWEAARR